LRKKKREIFLGRKERGVLRVSLKVFINHLAGKNCIHQFSDENKRPVAFLFVYFLDKTNFLFKKFGEKKINDNALIALALLVTESDPKEKATMVKIVKNLLVE